MKDSAQAIRDVIRRTGKTGLQNVLMRIPDKVCAAAFSLIAEPERAALYALVSEAKADRIREEIRLGGRRRMTPAVRARLLSSFVSYFRAGPTRDPVVWLRPVRPKDERR